MEQTENKEVKSKRDSFMERIKGKRPDLNYEDEDAFYGAIDDDYAEAEAYKSKMEEGNKKVTDFMNANPRNAQLFMDIMNGKDLAVCMLENYGDDFREALENPELSEKIAEANKSYQEKILKSREMEEAASANLTTSMDALTEAQNSVGADDEMAGKVFEAYCAMVNDAILNKVSKETWVMFFKALGYDTDIEDAKATGSYSHFKQTCSLYN